MTNKPHIKYSIALLGFLMMGCLGVAQIVTWGEDPRKLSRNSYFLTLGENPEGIYILSHSIRRGNINRFSLDLYEHNLKYSRSRNVRLRRRNLSKILVRDNSVAYITEPSRIQKGNIEYNAHILSTDLHTEIKQINLMRLEAKQSGASLFFKSRNAPNNQLLGVLGYQETGSQSSTLHYSVFDSAYTPLFLHRFTLPYLLSSDDIKQFAIDNAGNLYLVIEQTNRKVKAGEGRENSYLITFHGSDANLTTLNITEPEYSVKSCTFNFDPSLNRMMLTGFYGPEKNAFQEGIFQVAISQDKGQVIYQYFTEIPPAFLSQVMGEKRVQQGQLLSQFEALSYAIMPQGRGIFIAERRQREVYHDHMWANGMPITISKNLYHFDEILLFCIDSTGAFVWKKSINKKQTSENDYGYYSSVVVGVMPHQIDLFFNDRKESGEILHYSVDPNGEIHNKVLLRPIVGGTRIIPIESRQIGYNRTLIPVIQQGSYSLLKITYPHTQ